MNRIIKKAGHIFASMVIPLIDALILRRKNSFSFVVGKGNVFSGNLKAEFDYFHQHFTGSLSLLAHSASDLSLLEKEHVNSVIKTDSLKGLWALIRSECIIVEYGPSDWLWPKLFLAKHLVVNLWHGIPIKKICLAEDEVEGVAQEAPPTDICAASSHIDKAMMSSCLNVRYNNVLLTGYPRNDWLTCNSEELLSDRLSDLEQQVIARKKGRRLVLYAPTFRGNPSSDKATDNGVYCFSKQEWGELRRLFVENNAILGIRPHLNKNKDFRIPYDEVIVDMSRDVIPDVQMLLRNTDVLISDYSGVWVDFLLMDRPVVGFVHDWEEYNSERGYLYDYEAIFPGELVETAEGLSKSLERLLSVGEDRDSIAKRNFSKKIFHWYADGKACERVFNELTRRVKS